MAEKHEHGFLTGHNYTAYNITPIAYEWDFYNQVWEPIQDKLRTGVVLRFIRSQQIATEQVLIFATIKGKGRRFAIQTEHSGNLKESRR